MARYILQTVHNKFMLQFLELSTTLLHLEWYSRNRTRLKHSNHHWLLSQTSCLREMQVILVCDRRRCITNCHLALSSNWTHGNHSCYWADGAFRSATVPGNMQLDYICSGSTWRMNLPPLTKRDGIRSTILTLISQQKLGLGQPQSIWSNTCI